MSLVKELIDEIDSLLRAKNLLEQVKKQLDDTGVVDRILREQIDFHLLSVDHSLEESESIVVSDSEPVRVMVDSKGGHWSGKCRKCGHGSFTENEHHDIVCFVCGDKVGEAGGISYPDAIAPGSENVTAS